MHGSALKLWFVLRRYGASGVRAHVRRGKPAPAVMGTPRTYSACVVGCAWHGYTVQILLWLVVVVVVAAAAAAAVAVVVVVVA